MKISLGFFCVFRTIAIRFGLNCGISKKFLGLLSFLLAFLMVEGGQSSQHSIFLLVWDGLLLKVKVFWLTLFNTKDKRRNSDSQDIIFVLLSGLILKTCPCCHHCPKSGLISSENSHLLVPLSKSGLISENIHLWPLLSRLTLQMVISLKFKDTKTLGLKLM